MKIDLNYIYKKKHMKSSKLINQKSRKDVENWVKIDLYEEKKSLKIIKNCIKHRQKFVKKCKK